ncbi:MAG: ABC transporter permease subunit [Gemmataceae bacterium]
MPRRLGHYVLRGSYLGFLWILALTAWQAIVGWERAATIGDHARFAMILFRGLTYLLIIVIPFFSALLAASAVTREKERRTFVLLLLTDLRSYEIVLGKLLGSLLQIALLLIGTLPILALLMLLGGIAAFQVLQVGLVVAASALAAGALGNLVALWREKTFQVLAFTFLFLVLYECGVKAVPVVSGISASSSALAWFDPLLALQFVFEGSPGLFNPVYGYVAVMLLGSVALVNWGMLKLRVWNPSGEPIMQRERPEDVAASEAIDRQKAHAAPGALRQVWGNPILWREIRTRAYGRRPLLVKLAYFVAIAFICYYALLLTTGPRLPFLAAYGLVPVGILSMLLVAVQAVTAITSERDTGSLDLLLVTDLSPNEFIFGKLGGILWNAKEFFLPPFILAGVYGWLGLLASPPARFPQLAWRMNLEAFAAVEVALLLLLAFGVVFGIHVALRNPNSRLAVLLTLGTVFFLSVGTLICVYLILINGRFEAQWSSFVLFGFASIAGLNWVLNGERPSAALTTASILCPAAVFYAVTTILVGKPGSTESVDPMLPLMALAGSFGFAVAGMLIPLLSEFDVALGRTSAGGD